MDAKITLKAKTRKGKNRIKEHGSDWIVVRVGGSLQCFNGKPGVLAQPVGGNENARRWICTHDADFEIIFKDL